MIYLAYEMACINYIKFAKPQKNQLQTFDGTFLEHLKVG